MTFERDEIRRQLLRKGFRESTGDHHFYTLWVNGKKTHISTKLSHGTKYKVYDDSLIALVCRQLYLSKKELSELIECKLSGAEYVALLLRHGKLLS